jgi:hypothetical protein
MLPMSATAFANIQRADADAAKRLGQFEFSNSSGLALGGFNDILPGIGNRNVPRPSAAPADKKKKGKTPKEFTAANMESGFELRQLLDAGTPAKIEVTNEALQGIASTLGDLQSYDFEINLIGQEQIKLADDFTNSLSSGLAQAILNGQSLGDALLNSIKAAASELISSGLLNLLSGGKRGVSFGESISAVTSLFGGGRATGGSVMPGKAYVVGENRPELFVPSTSGYIMPRVPSGQGGGGQQSVNVTVNPSPLFITTVAQGAQAAAQETLRKSTRQRMPMSAGV